MRSGSSQLIFALTILCTLGLLDCKGGGGSDSPKSEDTSVAPKITSQPASQAIHAGQTATFTVAASGIPAPTYKWLRNEIAIDGATGVSLTTSPVTSSDSGAVFTVVVSNKGGSVTSNPATLTVTPDAFQIKRFEADTGIVPFGDSTKLTWQYSGQPSSLTLDGFPIEGLSTFVTPVLRQSYTLAGTNLGGSDSRTLKVAARGIDLVMGHVPVVSGTTDGSGSSAGFSYPGGLAMDKDGTLYVADMGSSTIRKVTPAGIVTTFAGSPGQSGSTDAVGSAARFGYISAMTMDVAGNLYVSDRDNGTIRKVTPSGAVSTLAGLAGQTGSVDGIGPSARFQYVDAIAVDLAGNVYAGGSDATVRKITPAGAVTTLAGSSRQEGSVDGPGAQARFIFIEGLAVDAAGNLYAADGATTIRKITPAGMVSTFAGVAGAFGNVDGTAAEARFYEITGLTIDKKGNLYLGSNCGTLRKVTPEGVVSTIAGQAGSLGPVDGPPASALLSLSMGLALDENGNIFTTDAINNVIRKVSPDGSISTLAGIAVNQGSTEGFGKTTFSYSPIVAGDSAGNLCIADAAGAVRTVSSTGSVRTLAAPGLCYSPAPGDPEPNKNHFGDIRGLARDPSGSVFIYDYYYERVQKIDPSGQVTFLGNFNRVGPQMAVDATGNLILTNYYIGNIQKVSPAGIVTLVAGPADWMNPGSADGPSGSARFNHPSGVALDSLGTIYVADTNNHTIRKITHDGLVSTFAGQAGSPGSADGQALDARFNKPTGLAVDALGNLYVGDSGNRLVRRITAGGVVSTLAGTLAGTSTPEVWTPGPLPGHLQFVGTLAVTRDGDVILPLEAGLAQITEPLPITTGPVPHVQSFTATPDAIEPGSSSTLKWEVAGADSLSLDQDIGTVTGTRLDVTPSVATTYTLTAANASGSTQARVTVSVRNVAPVITLDPISQSIDEGATATFRADASGNPAPTFAWYRRAPGSGIGFWVGSGKTLTLTPTYLHNGANIYVVATNPGGSAQSAMATLTVAPNPKLYGKIQLVNHTQNLITSFQVAAFEDISWGNTLETTPTATVWWSNSFSTSIPTGESADSPYLAPGTYLVRCQFSNGISQVFYLKSVPANQTQTVYGTGIAQDFIAISNRMTTQSILEITYSLDGANWSGIQLQGPVSPNYVLFFPDMAAPKYYFRLKRTDGLVMNRTITTSGGVVRLIQVTDDSTAEEGAAARVQLPSTSLGLAPAPLYTFVRPGR